MVESKGFSAWNSLALIALAIMNASWVAAFLRVSAFSGVQKSVFIILVYFTLLSLMASITVMAARALQLVRSVERSASIALLLLAIFAALEVLFYPGQTQAIGPAIRRYISAFTNLEFALRPESSTTLLILLLWRRGLELGRHWVGTRVVQRDFRIALLALLILGGAAAQLGRPLPYVQVSICLFAALMSMGAARLSALSHTRGGRSIAFDRKWFLAVSLGAAGLISIIGSLAYIGGEPLARGIGALVARVFSVLGAILLFLLRPVIVLLTELFNRLLSRLLPLISQSEPDLQSLPTPDSVSQMVEQLSGEIMPAPFAGELLGTIKIVLIALGIVGFIFIIYFSLRGTRAGKVWSNLEQGERERILISVPEYIRSLINRMMRPSDKLGRLSPAAQVIAAARIRQIYRQLLRLSARLGLERGEAQTPLEFLPHLPAVFPGSQIQLEDITSAYQRVRYGEYPESRQEVDQVEIAWQEVRKRARSLANVD
ncbi:MAG: DUF4129 domain-containing protein [Anaerolineales bacterium]|jgi:hypothetical protein